MNPLLLRLTRRAFLGRATTGLGSVALAALLAPHLLKAGEPGNRPSGGVVQPRHFPPRARRVIYLYMAGGPTHLETFDYKPELKKQNGKPMPESITRGQPIAQLQGARLTCLEPQHPFVKCGRSGQEISAIFPHLAKVADELCIVRSLFTEAINHDPAHTFMNTGTTISGRPSMGSWVWYGLGSDSTDLPGFVVLTSTGKFGQAQPISSRQWHSGFLPGNFQGVEFRSKGDPVLYVGNPGGVNTRRQRDVVEAAEALNRLHNDAVDDPEISTRISQYELAFRMQMAVPEVMDLRQEPKKIQELYGAQPGGSSFANNCLLARRLVERGVRFVQLYDWGWDIHGTSPGDDIVTALPRKCKEVDRPVAALLQDLTARGLLDETLVIWGGEFGRTSMNEERGGSKYLGRDHHPHCFTIWLAGGGVKGGVTHGATDELGYFITEGKTSIRDLQATILHLLGLDAWKLRFAYQGLQQRLIGPEGEGNVRREILT